MLGLRGITKVFEVSDVEVNVGRPGFDTEVSIGRPAIDTEVNIGAPTFDFDVSIGNPSNSIGSEFNTDAADLPTYSLDQIADQLSDGYWEDSSQEFRKFDVAPGGSLTVDITNLTVAGRFFARNALDAWEKVTGINFIFTSSGTGADIYFDDDQSGAYSGSATSGNTIQRSIVNVSTDWIAGDGIDLNSYSFQTYIHEIGHALGLGHAGNYNGTGGYEEDGSGDNHYLNDSWQVSIMSYFAQFQNTAIDASFAYVMTPMIADILAIQNLYGVPMLRTGDTTYGENSNAGGYYNTAFTDNVTFTIVDSGGIDTIDFASVSADQTVTLASEGISDVNGLTGNMIIARDTVIENFFSGSGDDYIVGNDANNLLKGGAGNDEIFGGDGDDLLKGQQGHDIIEGGNGADRIYAAPGSDTVNAGDGNDFVSGGAGGDTINGGNGDDNLRGNRGTDIMSGGDGNDDLRGGGGKDTLTGGEGDDFLGGGGGIDTIIGGAGQDTLRGGGQADNFVFLDESDSTDDANADIIEDFSLGEDHIDLSALTSGLSFIGAAGFSGTGGEIQAIENGSGETIVRVDVDGDGTADMQIVLEDTSGLTVDDFIL